MLLLFLYWWYLMELFKMTKIVRMKACSSWKWWIVCFLSKMNEEHFYIWDQVVYSGKQKPETRTNFLQTFNFQALNLCCLEEHSLKVPCSPMTLPLLCKVLYFIFCFLWSRKLVIFYILWFFIPIQGMIIHSIFHTVKVSNNHD